MSDKIRTVGGQDVARAIVELVRQYNTQVIEGIRDEVDRAAKDIKEGVQAKSPERTKKYRAGWGITKDDTSTRTGRVVHNKTRYRLVHLLEHGHGGPAPAGARPHVQPVSDPRLEEMYRNIEQIIKNGG